MLQITSAKVTASPGESGWVQVHGFSPGETESLHGQLFVVIASKNEKDGIDAISFERNLVGKIREEFYGAYSLKTFDALKNSLQKVISEPWVKEDASIEIICCAYEQGVLYSSVFGGGKVVIKRGESVATILESGGNLITASGFPKDGDMLVAGTSTFFEKVNQAELKSSLDTGDPEAAVENLTPIVYGGVENGTSGAIVIKFSESAFGKPEIPAVTTQEKLSPQTIPVEQKKTPVWERIGKFIPGKNVYVKHEMGDQAVSQSRKLSLSVGIILLIILAVSVGFGIKQKKDNDLKKEYQGILVEATDSIDRAIGLATSDPEESRRLFLVSEQKLGQILDLKVEDPKIDELQKKIEDARAAVLGEYLSNPELFLDLGLLSSGFKGDTLSSSGGNVYILDKNGSRVVSVAIDTKKSKVVTGPTVIESPQDIASYEDNVYVLLSDGIYLAGTTKSKIIDKTWGGDALIYAFGGNLYVLDKNGNAIYRYAGQSGNTFGSQQPWLSTSTKADFSSVLSWGMNGEIYVLYPNARILKYSRGSPQRFSLTGVTPEIGNVDALYADPDNTYVYLLDKAGKRVVVVEKDGKYKAQYLNDQIATATNLVVSEADKKIILLTGEKLLSIDLKNI